MLSRRALLALSASLVPQASWAHDGRVPQPHDMWRAWTFEPLVVIAFAVSVCAYVVGLRAHRARMLRARGVPAWRVHTFALGMLALAIALISPVDAVSAALFGVHMVQHLLLVVVAAPLIVAGE